MPPNRSLSLPYQTTPNSGLELLAEKYIVEQVRAKHARIPAHLTDSKFRLGDFDNAWVTWGSASAYVQPHDGKAYRVLVRPRCLEVADGLWATPMDVVRYYLDYKHERLPLRARGVALDRCRYPKRKAPGYAFPWKGDAAYYDLKSAYWSIVQVVGWDLEYSPGKYLRQGKQPYDFPYYWHKVARNTLVSIGIQSTVRQYNTETRQYRTTNVGNKYKNVMLWALVNDVLNALAVQAVAHGAVYVNTDGYIIPDDRAHHALLTMADWGLPIAMDFQGKTEVRYLASYRVGEKVTGHWLTPGYFQRLQLPVDSEWLRKRFFHFAKRTRFRNSLHVR